MKFVLASKNEGKLREIGAMIRNYDIELCLESDVGVNVDVEETGSTFEDNSILKAKAVMEATNLPAIAEDSGLCIDALDGAPGVYSARFNEGGSSYEDRCRHIISLMDDTTDEDRSASFVSVITCYFPNGDIIVARGECKGTIAKEIAGHNGFAYDMIFVPDGYSKTFAEMSPDEKNSLSHRGKAIKDFEEKFKEYRKLRR